jgi:outer membrane translocation and assembly module TamA
MSCGAGAPAREKWRPLFRLWGAQTLVQRSLNAILPLTLLLLSSFAHAECVQDYRSNHDSGVVVADFVITGTQKLSTAILGGITSKVIGSCFDDSSEELGERIRILFQDRGYLKAEVKSIRLKPGDPIAVPKPVVVEAEVVEGERYRLGQIKITGNHAFSDSQILASFPFRKGELFERSKIASAFDKVRLLYGSQGFLSMSFVPDVQDSSEASIVLTLNITEGPQYHMGELQVVAEKEMAQKLQAKWRLVEGAIFDSQYVSKYVAENHAILPPDFTPERVLVVTDCPNALTTVRIVVNPLDPKAHTPAHDIPCQSSDEVPR